MTPPTRPAAASAPLDLRGPMSGSELLSARVRLGLKPEELSKHLLADAERLAVWERGERTIPGIVAQRVRWLLSADERAKAIDASGLPACAWLEQWSRITLPIDDLDAAEKHMESVERHSPDCQACKDREAYLARRFPPLPPFPVEGSVIQWVLERLEALPPWLRPPAMGAAALAGIVSIRIVFSLPRLVTAPQQLPGALVALAAATGAGAAGGALFALVRSPLRRLGRAGDYLSGIAAVSGYMGALVLVAPMAFGESLVEGTSGWIILTIVSVVFGIVVGHAWLESKHG